MQCGPNCLPACTGGSQANRTDPGVGCHTVRPGSKILKRDGVDRGGSSVFWETPFRQLPKRTVTEVYRQFLAAKKADNASTRYLHDIQSRLGRLSDRFHGEISDLTTRELESWNSGLGCGPVARNAVRALVITLFNFARQRGYLSKHQPTEAAGVAAAKEPPRRSAFLPLSRSQPFLRTLPLPSFLIWQCERSRSQARGANALGMARRKTRRGAYRGHRQEGQNCSAAHRADFRKSRFLASAIRLHNRSHFPRTSTPVSQQGYKSCCHLPLCLAAECPPPTATRATAGGLQERRRSRVGDGQLAANDL